MQALPGVITVPSVSFSPATGDCSFGPGPARDFLRPERLARFSPVPNSALAFSYVNIAVMEQDRRNEPFGPASARVQSHYPPTDPRPSDSLENLLFLVSLPFFSPRPLLEECVCFDVMCTCASLSPGVLTVGKPFSCCF